MDEQNFSNSTSSNMQGTGMQGNTSQNSAAGFSSFIILPAHPTTNFDDSYFIKLLAGSISLSIDEKKKIIEAVPKLSQHQIDELIRIFEEEIVKFEELAQKHFEQVNKLREEHKQAWDKFEMENQQKNKVQEDQAKADEIRKQLGL